MKNLRSIKQNHIQVGLISWDYPFKGGGDDDDDDSNNWKRLMKIEKAVRFCEKQFKKNFTCEITEFDIINIKDV